MGRFGSPPGSVHGGGSPVRQLGVICPVAHKPTVVHKFQPVVYHRQPALYREICKLSSLINEDGALQHEDRVSTVLRCGSKCWLNILSVSYFYVLNLQPQHSCGKFCLS